MFKLLLNVQVFAEIHNRLKQQSSKNYTNDSALIVGNPSLHGKYNKLPLLPETAREVEEIASLLHVQPIVGADATCSYITSEMPNSKIVHIAAHGILSKKKDPNAYIPGALVLGDDNSMQQYYTSIFF